LKPKKRNSFSKDIRFVLNTDEFDTKQPETEQNLQELLSYMQESCDDLQVMIEGHASADGPPERNRELSKLRAQKVQQWLIDQGVAPTKIRGAMGFGSSMPRVVEPSPAVAKTMSKDQLEAIRRQNRRIEIAVLRDCSRQ
jgi:outer membrane protein OmpA-like peptidoglycan-associated protein